MSEDVKLHRIQFVGRDRHVSNRMQVLWRRVEGHVWKVNLSFSLSGFGVIFVFLKEVFFLSPPYSVSSNLPCSYAQITLRDPHPSEDSLLHGISAWKHLTSYKTGLICFKTRQLFRQPALSPARKKKRTIPKRLVFSTYTPIYSRE